MKRLQVFLLILTGCLFPPPTFSQQGTVTVVPFKSVLRVKLLISGDNGLDAVVRSYLTRELRKISDVEISDKDHDFIVGVCAIEARLRSGLDVGYILSYCVASSMNENFVKKEIINLKNEGKIDEGRELSILSLLNTSGLMDQFIAISDRDSLAKTCANNIAQIDGRQFEGFRKVMEAR